MIQSQLLWKHRAVHKRTYITWRIMQKIYEAASITIAKIQEICRLIPGLNNEINWDRGVSTKSKDNVKYVFKNGSVIDILAAKESSRGQRRTAGLVEECILVDGDILNSVVIPTINVDRRLPDGSRHPEEIVNKSLIFVTTAGYKNSFSYEKLIEVLINSIISPDEYIIMGGTYQTPVLSGLLNKNFVTELKLQGTFNEDTFDRQYKMICTIKIIKNCWELLQSFLNYNVSMKYNQA